MKLKKCIMTNSTCYKDQLKDGYYHWKKHKDKVGIVVHSTGANNPYIKRYVQPSKDDPNYNEIIADIGKNTSGNDWNSKKRDAGVHAFIGLNAHNEVETYQVLPYEWGAWGVGRGTKGSYNYAPVAHIQFEICENDLKDKKYFEAAFKEAIEYCAYLCEQFGWDASVICSHAESHARGYGGNHADCDHWLKKFGKSMDWFRAEVQKLLSNEEENKIKYAEYTIQKGDSLSAIARQHNTTVAILCEINNIQNPNQIYAEQVILVPTETEETIHNTVTANNNYIEYTIQKGDNLSKIAHTYNTTVTVLCEINNIENKNKIYVGQIILIPVVETNTVEPQPIQPEVSTKEPYPGVASTGSEEDVKKMWDFFLAKLDGNEYGTAGLMGNIEAESNFQSNNLQNSYERKEGIKMNDAEYTTAVDNGTYTNFVRDSAGYGLAQWTHWSRKEWLLNYAKESKKSIGDYEMQMKFLWKELSRDFKKVVNTLKTATSVREASDSVLLGFEKPANQTEENQQARARRGQKYYDMFHIEPEVVEPEEKEEIVETPTIPPVESAPTTSVEKEEEFSSNWIKRLLIAICEFLLKLFKK